MSDKYRIVSSLGEGNSSQVFLVEHRKLKAFRAVKCLKKSALLLQPQLLLETDILKNLKHPGIPTIYDVEEDDEYYYIIEEYVQGQSMEAYVLRQNCISIDMAVHMALQICDVMKYLHNQKPYPIIYQDLKPEHIILCGKRIVLIDFGISSYITSYGNTFQYFGTEGYAPPEKYQGNRCDIRSDIYGVGKVIAFMASKLRAEEFQFLQPLIEKATAYHMEERYPAVEVLEADLHGCIACGSLNFHNEKSKHLLKEIAVAGTQMRVGTTHIAIALTCFMNQYDRSCVYQEYHESDCMRLLINEDGGYMRNDGMIIYEKFRGIPYYGEGIEKWSPTEELSIQDYGTDLQDVLEENKHLVIVMGCRPWEKEQTKSLLEKISLRKNLVLICNYESSIEAKNIARMYRHRVYSFPLDADPFHMTREKRKLFQKLLRQEGW